MSKEASKPLFNIGEKVVAKDGTIFSISGVEKKRSGVFEYVGGRGAAKVRYNESSLQLYASQPANPQFNVLYAYENIRTGKVEKFTKQKNENQHSRRVPQFDEKWISE